MLQRDAVVRIPNHRVSLGACFLTPCAALLACVGRLAFGCMPSMVSRACVPAARAVSATCSLFSALLSFVSCLYMPNHCLSLYHSSCDASIVLQRDAFLLCYSVTKRRNTGDRCNSANNSRKPQKAHSKTESRPTSVLQRDAMVQRNA